MTTTETTGKTLGQAAYEARLAAKAARLGVVLTPNWDGLQAGDREDWEAGVQAAINAHELAAECDPSALNALRAERDQLADDFLFERKQVVALREVLTEMFTCMDAGDPGLLDDEQRTEWQQRAGVEATL